MNGGNAKNGTLGPTKLGELVVESDIGGSLELLPSQSVSSALELVPIAQSTLVTVPEPDSTRLLLAAGLTLCILRQRLRRQGRWVRRL